MRIENQRELPCSQALAWAALNDDAMLQACIPGCESLQRVSVSEGEGNGEGAGLVQTEQLQVVVMAAVGPVRARFKGQLTMEDVQAPQSYAMRFEGQGGVAGFGKGRAEVKLTPLDGNRCMLDYCAEVQIGGKLAQIGSRVVDAAANKIIGDFFARFEAELQLRQQAQQVQPAESAVPASAAAAEPAAGVAALAPMVAAAAAPLPWTARLSLWLRHCLGFGPAGSWSQMQGLVDASAQLQSLLQECRTANDNAAKSIAAEIARSQDSQQRFEAAFNTIRYELLARLDQLQGRVEAVASTGDSSVNDLEPAFAQIAGAIRSAGDRQAEVLEQLAGLVKKLGDDEIGTMRRELVAVSEQLKEQTKVLEVLSGKSLLAA
ncbi:CoxG family protein [Roseateles sp. PN1]|uniref:CoxG family protein n=1 Tax=Roseateles sp. PN1 TaxID=3137372 RepID=UPI0031398848